MKKLQLITFFVFSPILLFGWWEETHKLLSDYAYQDSKLKKDSLMWKFNLDRGTAHPLTVGSETRTAWEWILYGAEREDAGNLYWWDRSGRHFHNPLKVFSEAGLMRFLQHLQSSILWAQDGVEQNTYAEGNMSWQKAKDYYYNALVSVTETERNMNFGLMFKTLGHQIHLVQDMGNPEHTRNDNHPMVTIEKWAEKHKNDVIAGLCKNPIFPDVDLLTCVFDQSTQKSLSPISRLSDSDVYNLETSSPLTIFQQGLSEYTNANFVTDDTIFSSDFPFPRSSGLDHEFPEMIKDYVADEKAHYVSRNKTGEGEAINHFLRVTYLQRNLEDSGVIPIYDRSYTLDPTCYNDYIAKLIPPTVGYSAALINYFFRGEIEISLPEEGIYGFASYPEAGFDKITLMLKNITPNEDMKNGQLTLFVRYRSYVGDEFAGEKPPRPEEAKQLIKVNVNDITLNSNQPVKLTFDLPQGSPLPINAADVTLTVVFKGDLGTELTDAVGFGFKDISEPTAIEIFNDTGMVCFNGSMVEYTNPDLIYYADQNHDGVITKSSDVDIIPRTIRLGDVLFKKDVSVDKTSNTYFKFINNTNIEIDPGNFHRMYVLVDEDKLFYFSFLIGQKRFENSQVPFSPAWTVPYMDCKYVFMDYHYFLVSTNNKLSPSPMKPRINKLIWNGTQYEPYFNTNSFWNLKNHYYFNMFYYSQPNSPDGCTCPGCDTYKPTAAQEFKAFHYPNVVVCDYFINNCL